MAIGLLDGPDLLRMGLAPAVREDTDLAARIVADVTDPDRGVVTSAVTSVEATFGEALRAGLNGAGWVCGEEWTPFYMDLPEPERNGSLRVEVVGPELAEARVAVQRSAFGPGSTMTLELWRAMTGGVAYERGECLLGFDGDGVPVAVTTVWSAGRGRPGRIEPLGVHAEHRGRGYSVDITRAGAAALRRLGASTVTVATASSNVAACAAYVAAGFRAGEPVADFVRLADQ